MGTNSSRHSDLMDSTMYKNNADNGQTARTCDLATKKEKEKNRKEKMTTSKKRYVVQRGCTPE